DEPVISPLSNRLKPFFCHCTNNGAVPPAPTLKLAVPPVARVTLKGWLLMDGGNATVRLATTLVATPYALLMTTVYAPASPAAAGLTSRLVVAEPEYSAVSIKFVPFNCH